VYFEVGINSVCHPNAQYVHRASNHTKRLLPANLVLQSTTERIFVPPSSTSEKGLYADIPRGIFLVRGENVLLLGEIDLDKDDDAPPGYEKAEIEVVHKLAKERKINDERKDKNRLRKLREMGFEGENAGETLL